MRRILVALVTLTSLAIPGDQWYQWRGPNRDGKSPETGLMREWPSGGPSQLWKAGGLGAGFSSFAVSEGRLYTQGQRSGRQYVIALDFATGKKLWETPNGSAEWFAPAFRSGLAGELADI